MNTKNQALLKTATCIHTVPAIHSHGKQIVKGDVCAYKKLTFRNGETHIVLPNNKTISSCFFQI